MENKFTLNDFINSKKKVVNQEFEIQEMDLGMFYDLEAAYKKGDISLGNFANAALKDCIVSPVEAREGDKYFKNHPAARDMVLGAIRGFLGEGISRKPTLKFVSGTGQNEKQSGDISEGKTDGQ